MRVADFQGAHVYRLLPEGQRTKKDGTPKDPKKLGKVHLPVFTPDGRTVVGFMVKLPDIAGMIKQEDRFVALDALDVRDGRLVVADMRESYDAPAAKRLGVDLDACIIWTGMDVVTKAGKKLGYCADVTCHPRTGAVQEFLITPGAASSALIGHITMPVDMLVGYKRGAMVVADEAAALEFSGGAAAKAAEASVKVSEGVKKGAKTLDEKGSEAVTKGSRALGERIGKTGEAFKGFSDEYRKAAGTPAKKKGAAAKTSGSGVGAKKKAAPAQGSAARAVGKQLGKTTGMFQAFASEFKKASGSSGKK